jgi:hypothetical protein
MSDIAKSDEAMEIGILYRKARGSVVESVLYLREAGAKLAAIKKSLPHGSWLPWLAENADALGFESERTARRLMGPAKWDVNVRFGEDEAIQISREVWGNAAPKLPKPQRADDLDPDYEGSIDPDDSEASADAMEADEVQTPVITGVGNGNGQQDYSPFDERVRQLEIENLALKSEIEELKADRDQLRARVGELESVLATSGAVQGEKPKRGRGRPKGSKNKPKARPIDGGGILPREPAEAQP